PSGDSVWRLLGAGLQGHDNLSALINRLVRARSLDLSFLHRDRVGNSAIAGPRREIKVSARGDSIDADFPECERLPIPANIGLARGSEKVCAFPVPHYGSFSIRLDQHRRFLVNRSFTRSFGPSILHDAGEETQSAAHAVTLREVRIAQNIGGSEGVVVGLVFKIAVDKFTQHGEAGAGSADWLAGGDIRIDRFLDRSTFPAADVVGLIAAS